MKRRKLVIVSHTEHFKSNDGIIKGWGPTINEINYLSDYWQEIEHVACLHTTAAPPSALAYSNKNIHFVALPPFGGKTILDKLLILLKIPTILLKVIKSVKGASEVQLRLPTSMGLFLLPLFSFILPRKYTLWVKYAGNWGQANPPLSYRIQRWWLKKNLAQCKVTINGFWPDQEKHCYSFENPCLYENDIIEGNNIATFKDFSKDYTLTFVGRLDSAKGVDTIISALDKIDVSLIKMINFIGDGPMIESYKNQTQFVKDKVEFHGFLDSKKVHEILKESHFLLLPSQSEGFPKVVAEAACYGTIPIVSNVGSIGHYINENNGFLWELNTSYADLLNHALKHNHHNLKSKCLALTEVAKLYTFDNYLYKLNNSIIDNGN